jgi:uncharacterized protein YeaO (DUF488 family)
MPIRTQKHCRMAKEPEDGLRVLCMRYWPRGVRRDQCDIYAPNLAPSAQLLRAFRVLDDIPPEKITASARETRWQTLMDWYRAEMRLQKGIIEELRRRHRAGETLTLLCGCHDPARCHRTVLAALIRGCGK